MDARKGGYPGIDPEVYFKMLMAGFVENLTSERAIASRYAASLAIRALLHYGLTETPPHHQRGEAPGGEPELPAGALTPTQPLSGARGLFR